MEELIQVKYELTKVEIHRAEKLPLLFWTKVNTFVPDDVKKCLFVFLQKKKTTNKGRLCITTLMV